MTRIDLASGKVVADIAVPSEPHRVAWGAGAAWVGNWHDDSVSRIDPHTNRVVGSPIPIGAHHAGNLAVAALVLLLRGWLPGWPLTTRADRS